jgi:hypothetical protein
MRKVMGPHRKAVTRMLRATGLVHVPEEAPLVELLKDLADEMDNEGGARNRQAYLSALKDLRRVLNASSGVPHGSAEVIPPADPLEEPEPGNDVPRQNDLANFKQKHKIA